ncbi:MAG: hypothetical protein J0L77_02085 [Alphaproteobacteria bacterium]|nr:hypothetical protein [Alphaproteobacteria bacterium]
MVSLDRERKLFISLAKANNGSLVSTFLNAGQKCDLAFSHVGLQKDCTQLYGVFTLNSNPNAAVYLMPGDMASIAGQVDRNLTSSTYSPEEKRRLEHLSREMKRGIANAESYQTWVAEKTPEGRDAALAAQTLRQLPSGIPTTPIVGGHAARSEHGDMRLGLDG